MNRISNLQTIYAHGSEIYEKNMITVKPSSNCKVVTIKAGRVCRDCGKSLVRGTRCYTFNPKGKGRSWVCFSCIPEPNVEETRRIGERQGHGVDSQLVLFSEERDSLGRHKRMRDLTVEEWWDFEDALADAIDASMPNDY